MSKLHQQAKVHSTNRVSRSISVRPQTAHHMQEQSRSLQSTSNVDFVPVYEDIQKLAYLIHEEKGGSDLDNWLEAERVLKKDKQAQR